MLTVIADEDRMGRVEDVLFRHTTTFGLRFYRAERACLQRSEDLVDTRFGPIKMKRAFYRGKLLRSSPEYEDCKRAAEANKVSVKEVYDAASAAQ